MKLKNQNQSQNQSQNLFMGTGRCPVTPRYDIPLNPHPAERDGDFSKHTPRGGVKTGTSTAKLYAIAKIFTVFALPFFLYCIYPVYDGDGAALEERQSVWQYLSVFSIYQERLPAECGDYTPLQLFDIIDDTLKGGRYTGYRSLRGNGPGASVGLAEARAAGGVMLEITKSTAYICIYGFWPDALSDFQSWRGRLANYRNIVIDLRGNGGGYLYVSDSIIGEFIPYDAGFIKTRYREYDNSDHRGKTVPGPAPDDWTERKNAIRNPMLANKKIAVIIDGWSASASEILASGLKDCANAYLIGVTDTAGVLTKSYGKGIGQVILPRSGRDSISVTFMQIRGVSERTGDYHRKGIVPDTVPAALINEAPDSCTVNANGQKVTAQTLYCSVKLLEPDAPSERIREAAETIERSRALRKAQGGGSCDSPNEFI